MCGDQQQSLFESPVMKLETGGAHTSVLGKRHFLQIVGVGSEDSQKQGSEVAVRVHHKAPVQKEPKGALRLQQPTGGTVSEDPFINF